MAIQPSLGRGKGNRFPQLLMWIIGIAVATVVAFQVMDEARRARLLNKGSMAPPFVADRFVGGQLQSDQLRGKVVMLDFWATWCPPCVEEMPALTRLAEEYQSQGLIFVAANRDDPSTAEADVSRFIERNMPKLAGNVVYANDQMSSSYRVTSLPTLYFIDRAGRIRETMVGYSSESTLRRRIEQALKSPSP